MGKETSLQPVPGYGCAEFRCIPQKVSSADESHPIKLKTMNSRLYFTHPLKLLVTRQFSLHCLAQSDCQWIYKVQSGGSHTSLNIDVGENCKVVFTTQEYPKILASDDDSIGEQHLKVHVADGAILAVLPDPIICYKNAKFQQEQVFHLTSNANLILLDWLIAGRIALGEVWEMISFASESKVYVDGKLVHGDAIRLDRDLVNVKDNMCSLQKALEYTKVLGSCVFIGPQFRELKWKIQEKVKSLSGIWYTVYTCQCVSTNNSQ
ncbi:uncharacterized protein [Pocillopora verrucosa]|uniref:uncharacterized protein n=1 Tax=Pocillopora verrucosa TaxID=203993 RepID=UPI003340EC18